RSTAARATRITSTSSASSATRGSPRSTRARPTSSASSSRGASWRERVDAHHRLPAAEEANLRRSLFRGGESRLVLDPLRAALRVTPSPSVVDRLLAGDKGAIARLVSWAENGDPRFPPAISALHPKIGNAWRIGVTGPPGAGKSTLVNELAKHERASKK